MTQRYFAALVLLLAWLPAAAFAQTISSFSPASGNAGTLVTLRGTDLNLVTAVAVNGTSCVILDKTNSTLHLLVMPAATSGPVTTTGGAPAASATAFAVTRPAVNPAQQGAKLVGTAAVGRANQGWSMALSADGNTLAVGGPYDKGGAGFTTGATWVFARSGSAWSQQGPKLVGTGTFSGHMYQGTHIALSADGNTLAVGGSISDGTGATWVFTRSGSAWSQQGSNLVGAGAESNRTQSYAVALSADGNTLAMGEFYDGNRGDGATWVFTRSGTAWSQQGPKLVGTGAVGQARQGWSVALSADGNTLAVGGLEDNGTGATWVFVRSATTWSQQGPKLVGTGAVGPYVTTQGCAVALSADGNTLAVGGPNDHAGSTTGATWVFTRSGSAWSQQGPKLVGTGAVGIATFQGHTVALSADGNTLAVGGYSDNSTVGATWLFTRSGTAWSQQGPKIVGAGAGGAAHQGSAVALSADGNTLAVGGLFDNNGIGAAWVFSMSGTSLAQQAAVGPRARGSFFPNPVSEQLTVTGGASRGTLRLYDSTDRLLRSTTYLEGQSLNLSALPAGLYWLMLDQAPAQPLLKR